VGVIQQTTSRKINSLSVSGNAAFLAEEKILLLPSLFYSHTDKIPASQERFLLEENGSGLNRSILFQGSEDILMASLL
jgi:hypothetical protein